MFRDNEFNHIVNRIMIYDSYVIERVLKWTEKTFLFASLGKKTLRVMQMRRRWFV